MGNPPPTYPFTHWLSSCITVFLNYFIQSLFGLGQWGGEFFPPLALQSPKMWKGLSIVGRMLNFRRVVSSCLGCSEDTNKNWCYCSTEARRKPCMTQKCSIQRSLLQRAFSQKAFLRWGSDSYFHGQHLGTGKSECAHLPMYYWHTGQDELWHAKEATLGAAGQTSAIWICNTTCNPMVVYFVSMKNLQN